MSTIYTAMAKATVTNYPDSTMPIRLEVKQYSFRRPGLGSVALTPDQALELGNELLRQVDAVRHRHPDCPSRVIPCPPVPDPAERGSHALARAIQSLADAMLVRERGVQRRHEDYRRRGGWR